MELNLAEYIDSFIYHWGVWEPDESWLIAKLLSPGDSFVDVGANVGYFSLLASRLVGSQGRVFSFEPMPSTAARLRNNLAINNITNVTVLQHACSDHSMEVPLTVVSPRNPGAQTMRTIPGLQEIVLVDAVRLDDVLPPDERFDLVKLDIEGAEVLAIRGLKRHLERGLVSTIICEVTSEFLVALGTTVDELFEIMNSHGFTSYLCHRQSLKAVSVNQVRRGQFNVVFSRSDTVARLAR